MELCINDKEIITLPPEVSKAFENAENLILEGSIGSENYNEELNIILLNCLEKQEFTAIERLSDCFPIYSLITKNDDSDRVKMV